MYIFIYIFIYIYIYIYIYRYNHRTAYSGSSSGSSSGVPTSLVSGAHIHSISFVLRYFRKVQNICFQICSYIQKITLNRIETFKLSTYNTKHTKHIRLYFQKLILISSFFQKHIFKNWTSIRISVFRLL